MGLVGRSLVSAQQPPLGQRRDAVHGGQQLAGVVPAGAGGPLAAPLVHVAEPGRAVGAHPGTGDDRGARLNRAGHEWCSDSAEPSATIAIR